jgi:K+-sensing histidine kinase KdpD
MNAPLPDERSPLADGYPQTVALIALTTAAAVGSRRWLALPDVAMLYLLVIVAVAVRYGRGPSVLASALSVATYDFFFIAPVLHLRRRRPAQPAHLRHHVCHRPAHRRAHPAHPP